MLRYIEKCSLNANEGGFSCGHARWRAAIRDDLPSAQTRAEECSRDCEERGTNQQSSSSRFDGAHYHQHKRTDQHDQRCIVQRQNPHRRTRANRLASKDTSSRICEPNAKINTSKCTPTPQSCGDSDCRNGAKRCAEASTLTPFWRREPLVLFPPLSRERGNSHFRSVPDITILRQKSPSHRITTHHTRAARVVFRFETSTYSGISPGLKTRPFFYPEFSQLDSESSRSDSKHFHASPKSSD